MRHATMIDGLLEIEDWAARLRIGRHIERLMMQSISREWSFYLAVEVALLRAFLAEQERRGPYVRPDGTVYLSDWM